MAPAPPSVVKPAVQPRHLLHRTFVPDPKPAETHQLIASAMPEIEVPRIIHTMTLPTAPVLKAPSPVVAPTLTPQVIPPAPVRTGLFGGAAEHPTTKLSAQQVQTGGFGSPQGLPGHAEGGSQGNVAKLGSFGLPEGPGHGNGTGGSHGAPGVVASAGFGSEVAGSGYSRGGSGTGDGPVNLGGFEKSRQMAKVTNVSLQTQAPAADFQPIEILSKPSPLYTEQARQLRIQGEVALSVRLPGGTARLQDQWNCQIFRVRT